MPHTRIVLLTCLKQTMKVIWDRKLNSIVLHSWGHVRMELRSVAWRGTICNSAKIKIRQVVIHATQSTHVVPQIWCCNTHPSCANRVPLLTRVYHRPHESSPFLEYHSYFQSHGPMAFRSGISRFFPIAFPIQASCRVSWKSWRPADRCCAWSSCADSSESRRTPRPSKRPGCPTGRNAPGSATCVSWRHPSKRMEMFTCRPNHHDMLTYN